MTGPPMVADPESDRSWSDDKNREIEENITTVVHTLYLCILLLRGTLTTTSEFCFSVLHL